MKQFLYEVYKRFLTWFGDQMLATEPPKTKAVNILKMMELIQPGDVICRKYTYYLDSYFIPGEYSHSGIVIDTNKMYHSTAKDGVHEIHPIDFIKDCDGFIILRPNNIILETMIMRAKWHIDQKTQYDFTFEDPNGFYCHEFTCDCLKWGGLNIPKIKKTFGVLFFKFERELFLADQIIKNCQIIYEME